MFKNANKLSINALELPIDEMMHFILEDQEDIIWLLMDEEERIIAYSPSIHHYEEISESFKIGEKLQEIVPEDVYRNLNSPKITENTDISKVEISIDDSLRYFKMKRRKLVFGSDTYEQVILKDITYTKQLEQKVYENEKMLQSAIFAMGMIHEFRNPLTSIKGFLQLLQAGVKQETAYYNVMINEVDKLEEISNNLLQLSKPYETKKENAEVGNLIQDIIFLFQTQINMRNVFFQVDVEENMICYCNARQIKQVFLNLIKNAAEAIEYDGLIQINAYKNDNKEQAIIEIIDSGTGVTEDVVREMSTPFYSTKKEGTGLGLSISFSLLAEHEGTLLFGNHEQGGVIATVTLPIIQGVNKS